MRLLSCLPVACLLPLAHAIRLIESKALSLCSNNAGITSTHFNVVFTPQNQSIALGFDGISSLSGKVIAELVLTVYGYTALRRTLDPCEMALEGLCPLHSGAFPLMSTNIKIPESVVKQIPGIAYNVPDLDASVRVYINSTETGRSLTCIEAALSNGKTVYQPGVGWTTAVISGLGVAVSTITSGLGHSKTATHIAVNVLSLFSFMQSQAMIGMTAVHMPPIVQSWTQNFQWSMGIIHVGFLDRTCTWYQRATGGAPSTVLANLSKTSIHVVKKRSLPVKTALLKRITTTIQDDETVVRGIQRVGFRAHIEPTNIFLTGLIFFVVFIVIVMILIALHRVATSVLTKTGKIRRERLKDIVYGSRASGTDWPLRTQGILFRLIFIGFPQMCILCLWEFTRNDSPAEELLAAVMLLSCGVLVGFGAYRVMRYARQSVRVHSNPAYILYSDLRCLTRWGVLYMQYRATAYPFILAMLGYTVMKSLFISLCQTAPVVQTIALVIIEAAMLIAASVVRPWMDKRTNVCNVAIAAVHLVNAIFLLVFSDIFDQPPIISGVMGVVFFVYNAAFVLGLLVLVLLGSGFAIVSKDPDTRYRPMGDDRGSFLRSHSNVQLTTELDALGATARGDVKTTYSDNNSQRGEGRPEGSHSTPDLTRGDSAGAGEEHLPPLPPSMSDLSVPLIPSEASRRSPLSTLSQDAQGRLTPSVSRGNSPATVSISSRTTITTDTRRSPNPWHRGAGYENERPSM